MTVRYPGGKAVRNHHPFPLVIFSADPGDGTELPDLAGHWVSHGFVVITLLNEREAPRTSRPAERVPFDVRQLDRLGDVVFVLGALDQVERRLDGFHGRHAARIDRERMGVAGYSMGALTAQMAIGVKVRVAGREGEAELRDAGDARFKAAVLISPQGTINRMLTRDSWNEVSKPLLVVTGSHDVVPGSRETPESRQEPFLLARPGHKFLLFLEGATHTSYSLFASQSRANSEPAPDAVDPDPRVSANATDAVTLAFWDAFLLNDERGREYLASDEVKKLSGGRAQLRRR
jgi:predicted dienelactone hydrolase